MTRTIIRTITAALATVALAAPTALAQPADLPALVGKAAAAAQHQVDLRSPDTRDAARRPARLGSQTSPARPSVPGPPTWPENPQPIKPVPAVHASDTGGGLNGTTLGLGIAGSLLAIGGIVGIARRSRRIERARVTA